MANGCCSPRNVIVVTCPSDCPDTPEINLTSINLSGIGVLDSWDGTQGNFRGVASASGLATVTLDGTNHVALITLVPSAIQAALGPATESLSGPLEVATTAETTAGAADDKIITPLKLAQKNFFSVVGGNTTTLASGTANLTIQSGAGISVNGNSTGIWVFESIVTQFYNGTTDFDNQKLNFGGGDVALTLLGADSSSNFASYQLVDFISTNNIQGGWVAPTGTVARGASSTYPGSVISNPPTQAQVQGIDFALMTLSQHVGALIIDLMAKKLPAT